MSRVKVYQPTAFHLNTEDGPAVKAKLRASDLVLSVGDQLVALTGLEVAVLAEWLTSRISELDE